MLTKFFLYQNIILRMRKRIYILECRPVCVNLACVHAASVAVHSVTFWHTGPVILVLFCIYTSLGCLDSGDRSKSSGLWKLDGVVEQTL